MNVVQHEGKCVTRVAGEFDAKNLGAPFKIILKNSVKLTLDEETKEIISYTIPDLDGLIRTVVITRILHNRKLSGVEIKFIRKAIGIKQKDLASKIEMSVEHLSRCETGMHVMSPGSEKLLRIFALKTVIKLHSMKSNVRKKKLEDALDQLFNNMKPISAFNVEDDLVLYFHRDPICDAADSSSDDSHWDEDIAA